MWTDKRKKRAQGATFQDFFSSTQLLSSLGRTPSIRVQFPTTRVGRVVLVDPIWTLPAWAPSLFDMVMVNGSRVGSRHLVKPRVVDLRTMLVRNTAPVVADVAWNVASDSSEILENVRIHNRTGL